MGDHVGAVQVITASLPDEIADGRPGRQWALPLADRVLLVATYWRTNLTTAPGSSVSTLVAAR
jgi:hypothetical protein